MGTGVTGDTIAHAQLPVEQATRQRRDTVTTQPQAMVEAHAMEVTATQSAAMLVIAKVPDVLSIFCLYSVYSVLYTLYTL